MATHEEMAQLAAAIRSAYGPRCSVRMDIEQRTGASVVIVAEGATGQQFCFSDPTAPWRDLLLPHLGTPRVPQGA